VVIFTQAILKKIGKNELMSNPKIIKLKLFPNFQIFIQFFKKKYKISFIILKRAFSALQNHTKIMENSWEWREL
jgi:hypothetical protein